MSSDVRQHVIYQLMNAPVRAYPFAHVCVENVFPDHVYDEMIAQLPADAAYTRLIDTSRVKGTYSPERLCLFPSKINDAGLNGAGRTFWTGLFQSIVHDDFTRALLVKFEAQIVERFGGSRAATGLQLRHWSEMFLMRDLTSYELGPHTDSPAKLISALFYLAPDDAAPDLGTALYVPRERGTTCPGGPHHAFDLFDRVVTMPYRRNVLVAFPKTPACFHGVERVGRPNTRRDLMLFDTKGETVALEV
jgi:hypothetical protein